MKELQLILETLSKAGDEQMILATVVEVIGSGYRRAGARMLINADGYSIGTVSGGCLEADVLERAKRVLETNAPTIITYDTTKDESSVFGLGMGCRGIIRVLLEAVNKDSRIFKAFATAVEYRSRKVVATLIGGENIGGRVYFGGENQINLENLPAAFEALDALRADCAEVYDCGKSKIAVYETEAGAWEFFIERIEPPLNLLLFGAGFDALPVVKFAKEIGWRVMMVDHRAAFANASRMLEADEIIVSRSEDLPDALFTDENTAAVIMTHNYERDRDILHRLLNSHFKYIGALGPKTRTEKLIAEIRADGRTFDEANLAKLHAPIGLDIGSESPEEIALAVVAEIKTVLANRIGGFLRDKDKPIHNS